MQIIPEKRITPSNLSADRFVENTAFSPRFSNFQYCLPVKGSSSDTTVRIPCTVDGCNKSYTRGDHLRDHIRSHYQSHGAYECVLDNCGKQYSSNDHLMRHIKTAHAALDDTSGKKRKRGQSIVSPQNRIPYKQQRAAEATSSFAALSFHSFYRNLEDKRDGLKVVCPDCNQQFSKKSNLVKHIEVIHRQKKSFYCPIEDCNHHYGYLHVLDRHIKKHHEDVIFNKPAQS